MKSIVIALYGQAVALRFSDDLQEHIDLLFGPQASTGIAPQRTLSVWQSSPERYSIGSDATLISSNLKIPELLDALLEAVVSSLIENLDTGIALHAASIGCGDGAAVIAGPSGAGKTSLAGHLVAGGFEFLSDELTILTERSGAIVGFPRPLLTRPDGQDLIGHLTHDGTRRAVRTAANVLICADERSAAVRTPREPALIIFPRFSAGIEFEIARISPAIACLKLIECNLNARNLPDHGVRTLAEFAGKVPAISVNYGSYQQLHHVADLLAQFSVRPADLDKLVAAVAARQSEPEEKILVDVVSAPPIASGGAPASSQVISEQSAASVAGESKKLTIGMATYDDYDGVYFTVQAIRMYHPEILDDVEFLVIDNHPMGRCASGLKDLENWIANYRYVPKTSVSGTAIRDAVFREARGEFVLCVDCHIFIVPGALRRLLAYFESNRDTSDLLQGPMIYDDLKSYSTHFKPGWEAGMYGTWDSDPAGAEPDQPPFEIPMQGLGLFACRRSAWPGFNPAFRGFGGEEGYIHGKFRQRGGKTLCLPFLRWMHRFNRPLGTPYTNVWEDRVQNYLIGFRELGWDTAPVIDHFRELLGPQVWEMVTARLGRAVLYGESDKPNAEPDTGGGVQDDLQRPFKPEAALSGEAKRPWLKTASVRFGSNIRWLRA